jgi:hypothetical protein
MAVEKKASLAAKKSASGLGVTWGRRVVRVCVFATYMDVLGERRGRTKRWNGAEMAFRFFANIKITGAIPDH